MKKIKLYIYIILSLSLFSCFNQEIGKALVATDSLSIEIKQIEEKYNSIDFVKFNNIYDTIKQDIDTIGKYMITLPENKEWKNSLSIYQNAYKQSKQYVNKKFNHDIEYSKNQIQNLRTDISRNAINADSLKQYIKTEKDAINTLRKDVNTLYLNYNQALDKYNKSKTNINLFIDSLISTNKKDIEIKQ